MVNDDGWTELVGAEEAELPSRLGVPAARHATGDDSWLVFDTAAGRLRVRCYGPAGRPRRVASWTLVLAAPAATLREALVPLGLWPAPPDTAAADVEEPLVRRVLTDGRDEGELRSLTATIRAGRFTHVSVFDEPPDWI